jgi:hypothetical protein
MKYILTKEDSSGKVVLSRSKNLSYVNRRMSEDWTRTLEPVKKNDPNHRRCFFVNEYAFIEGVASWSIDTE